MKYITSECDILKEKYAKTKENIQESLAAEISSNAQSYKDDCIQQESMPDLNSNNVPEMDLNQFTDDIGTISNNELLQNNIANQLKLLYSGLSSSLPNFMFPHLLITINNRKIIKKNTLAIYNQPKLWLTHDIIIPDILDNCPLNILP